MGSPSQCMLPGSETSESQSDICRLNREDKASKNFFFVSVNENRRKGDYHVLFLTIEAYKMVYIRFFIRFSKYFVAVFCKNRSFSVKIIEYKKMFGIIKQYAC